MKDQDTRAIVRIVLTYALVAGLWILFSDRLLSFFVFSAGALSRLQTYKGWFFVAATALLLFYLLRRELEARRRWEMRYQQLFNTSPDALFLLDARGHIQDANGTAVVRYGYRREELLRLTAHDLAAAELKDQAPSHLRWALNDGARFTWRHRRRDGGEFPVEINAHAITLNGRAYILSSVRDITERVRTQKELRQQQEILRTILNNAPFMVAFLGPDGMHRWVNRTWEQTFGWSLEEIKDRDILKEFYPDPDYRRYVLDFIEKSEGGWSDFKTRRRDGTVIETSWINVPLSDGSNIGIGQDITERMRVEKALQVSEERLRLALQAAKQGLYDLNIQTGEAQVTPEYATMLGYDPDEFQETNARWIERLHPDDRERVAEAYRAYIAGEVPEYAVEFRQRTQSGDWKWILSLGKIVARDDEGKPLRMLGTHTDITEQKRAQEALRQSRARYYELFDRMRSGVAVYEAIDGGDDFRIKDINRAGVQISQVDRRQVIGRRLLTVFPGVKEFGLWDVLHRVWRTGEPEHFPLAQYRDERISQWVENHVYKLPSGEVVAVYDDVTERVKAEKALRESHHQLRALAAYLQDAREKERSHIAREIHDEFGQALTALKIDLSWMAKRLPEDEPALRQRADSMLALTDDTIGMVRRIATELRPGLLDDLGLAAALEWQAGEFSRRTGIACELHLEEMEPALGRNLATALFRIFQEALTNVARHAQAGRVTVRLAREAGDVVLMVQDDGRGISLIDVDDSRSLGLTGMRERARAWNGGVTFEGVPGQGTTVTARIPGVKGEGEA